MADEPRVRYSATNRRPVGQIVVQFRRHRLNGNMGELVTRYTASTHVPAASGTVKFGVETKMMPSVQAAYDDLKDQLVNRYFVTGALKIERSASDNVVNAQINALKRSQNVNESFDNNYPNRKDLKNEGSTAQRVLAIINETSHGARTLLKSVRDLEVNDMADVVLATLDEMVSYLSIDGNPQNGISVHDGIRIATQLRALKKSMEALRSKGYF